MMENPGTNVSFHWIRLKCFFLSKSVKCAVALHTHTQSKNPSACSSARTLQVRRCDRTLKGRCNPTSDKIKNIACSISLHNRLFNGKKMLSFCGHKKNQLSSYKHKKKPPCT